MSVSPTLLVGFLALSAVLSAVPGPSVLLETSRAVTHGRRSALWIVLGNGLGGLLLLALVVSGLGVVVTASRTAFDVVRVLGAGYLCWLGIAAVRSARSDGPDWAAVASPPTTRWRLVRRGLLAGLTNPKSIVSLMAVLPQFVDHSRGHVVVQLVVIGLAGAAAQAVIEVGWVLAADRLRGWFLRRPRRLRRLRTAGGVAMIGFAGRLVVDR